MEMLDTQDLKVLGSALVRVAVLLIVAGLFAKYYSRVSSTPVPPILYATISPYEAYWAPLIVAAIPTLLAGMVLLWRTRV